MKNLKEKLKKMFQKVVEFCQHIKKQVLFRLNPPKKEEYGGDICGDIAQETGEISMSCVNFTIVDPLPLSVLAVIPKKKSKKKVSKKSKKKSKKSK